MSSDELDAYWAAYSEVLKEVCAVAMKALLLATA
jgi:hypothetical protein